MTVANTLAWLCGTPCGNLPAALKPGGLQGGPCAVETGVRLSFIGALIVGIFIAARNRTCGISATVILRVE